MSSQNSGSSLYKTSSLVLCFLLFIVTKDLSEIISDKGSIIILYDNDGLHRTVTLEQYRPFLFAKNSACSFVSTQCLSPHLE